MKKRNLWIFFFGINMLTSCMVSKKVVYVNDMNPDSAYNILEVPVLKLQRSDRLNIKISAKNPELAAPFNAIGGSYTVGEKGGGFGSSSNNTDNQSYLIDQQGNIAFPILGSLHLVGLSMEEVRDLLGKRLVDGGFINDPIVKVEILNLKVNVIGEVNRVGIIEVPDAKINLLEAISKAGGMTRNAASDRVAVIREENGVRRKFLNNIESQAVFESPTYYLQQNDIVYVEPKVAQSTPKEDRTWQFTSMAMGALTVILTALNLLK